MNAQRYQLACSLALVLLIALCLAWEGWLAPLRAGGSWLILKGAFLLPAVFGILRGKRYTYKWMSLFIQFYLMEGLLRATSDTGLSRWLAAGEAFLAVLVFVSAVLYIRSTRTVISDKATQPG